jgi:hypothetical protein
MAYVKKRETDKEGRRASPVEVVLRDGSVLKTTSLRKKCSELNEARFEVMALAMLEHVIAIKRLPPWVTKILDYGNGVNINNFLPFTVDLVTEKADVTLYDWLLHHLRAGYEKGSRELSAFQHQLDGVFAQLVLALYAFRKHTGFVHNDLHLRNVLLQHRPGTGNMRYDSEGVFYVFDETVPLMKLCDFGHAYVVHPVTRDVSPGAYFGCPLGALNNCTDITKFCIGLARMRPSSYERQQRLSRFSDAMFKDLDSVLRPLGDSIARCSESMENFAFPMGAGFVTPLQLIRRGSVVRLYESASKATYANTFHELENDDWEYGGSAAKNAFALRERETEIWPNVHVPASPHLGFKLMNLHFSNPHFGFDISVLVPVVKRALFARMEALDGGGGVMAFGGGEFFRAQNAHVRKRMLWSALTFYQRGVMFYMHVFAPAVVNPSCVLKEFTQDGSLPGDIGILDEQAAEAVRLNAMFNPELAGKNMALRYSLWAACGGFADFFDVFNGVDSDQRHFRRDEGASDVPHAVLRLYQAVTANGWRAPIQYAALEDVHDASEETLTNAFIASSNVCYYSYTVEQALSVLKI